MRHSIHWPVTQRFTEAQREVYRIVLKAQKAAVRAVKPGRPWNAPHDVVRRTLTQGLVELAGGEEALMEAARRSDEIVRIQRVVSSDRDVFVLLEGFEEGLTDELSVAVADRL